MRKIIRIAGAALLLVGLCLTLAACCGDPSPNHPHAETTPSETDPPNIPPFESRVEIIGKDGNTVPHFTAPIYFTEGSLTGDGELMFLSVPEFLALNADQIPQVELGDAPEICTAARSGVEISGGETVSVYGEDYALLEENIPVSELAQHGKSRWQGKTVYIYFTVTFRQTEVPDYTAVSCDGYFIRTVF